MQHVRKFNVQIISAGITIEENGPESSIGGTGAKLSAVLQT